MERSRHHTAKNDTARMHPASKAGGPRRDSPLIALQAAAGNQAVSRLIAGGVIQRLSVDDYRTQMNRKGNFSLGSATREVANQIGADWIGTKPYAYASVSEDGLHQYRKGREKAKTGRTQANVEGRTLPQGPFTTNGHITIVEEKKD